MNRRWMASLAAAVTVAVVGAGCSDAADDAGPAPTTSTSTTATAAAATAPFFHLGGDWVLRDRGEGGSSITFPDFRSAWGARYSTTITRLPDGRTATSSLGLAVLEGSLDDVTAEAEAEVATKGKPLQVLGTTGIHIELKDGRSTVLWQATETQVGVLIGHLDPTPSAVVSLLHSVSRDEWLALETRDEVETSPDSQPSYAPTPPEG